MRRFDAILSRGSALGDAEVRRSIVLGGGGVYDTDLLVVRQDMLDELEATLSGFRRDLELLERYVVQLSGAELGSVQSGRE
jgi:hypothetical protein